MVIRPYPDTLVLTSVCQHPFATVSVLSGLNDVGEQRVKRSLDRLMAGGLVDRIWPRPRGSCPAADGTTLCPRDLTLLQRKPAPA